MGMGFLVDKVGQRATLLLMSSTFMLASHSVMTLTDLNPLTPLIILGLAYTIYASAIQNLGLAVFPLIVASLTRKLDDETKDYYYVGFFFMGLAATGILVAVLTIVEDMRTGSRL